MTNQWPAETISQEAFAAALQAIGVPEANIVALVPPSQSGLVFPDKAQLLEDFIKAVATPKQRQTLSKAAGCAYEELTNWVIRADLLRIEGLDAQVAALMVSVGVKGAHDLAACCEHPQRLSKLQSDLKHRLEEPQLKGLGATARKLDSRVVADVSVILVVKGGGEQKPDETLDVFVNGFWPAVKSIDAEATISKRRDIFPSDYRSSAYDKEPLNHVTEICSGERRIWIKEPCWEAAFVPDSPLNALSKEWRMATYAFGSGVHEIFFDPDTRERLRQRSFWRYYFAFVSIYFAIFLHIGLAVFAWNFMRWVYTLGRLESSAWRLFALSLITEIILALLLAILPAVETRNRLKIHDEGNGRLEALPGVAGIVVMFLILAFLYSPWGYIVGLLFWVVIELALLRARAIAWPRREISNSDSATEYYYSVAGEKEKDGSLKVYKFVSARRRRAFILVYRYIVVLSLPITFLGLSIARLLKWTRLLGGIGEGLEKTLSLILSGFLGDVVTYAMNPAQAHRVRSVVQTDLMFFHDQPEVSDIHVFAHSQGTPITFEVLFHHLSQAYRSKIKTYATIGSVLSYYNQANPVLDPYYIQRFPVRPYPDFANGFKWMNFWNLIDPITEFYGLDEYNVVTEAPMAKLKPDGKVDLDSVKKTFRDAERHPVSPTNIKTRATLENHSEYWSNQEQVHVPLALRVLGVLRPEQWNSERQETFIPEEHISLVSRHWGILSAIFLLLFLLDTWVTAFLVNLSLPVVQQLASLIPAALKGILDSQSYLASNVFSALIWLAHALAVRYGREAFAIITMLSVPAIITLLLALIAWLGKSIICLVGETTNTVKRHLTKKQAGA